MVCAETCVTKYASSTSHRSRSRDRRRTRAVLETERSCRHRVVRPNVAPPLWGRLPARARPRDQCAAVARPVSRVPAARSARRDPRRALRIRNVERAVRVAGRGDEAARGAALCGGCSLLAIGTSDPLNLAGIVTPGERVRSAGRNRMVYRDDIPLAVMEGDFLRELSPSIPPQRPSSPAPSPADDCRPCCGRNLPRSPALRLDYNRWITVGPRGIGRRAWLRHPSSLWPGLPRAPRRPCTGGPP